MRTSAIPRGAAALAAFTVLLAGWGRAAAEPRFRGGVSLDVTVPVVTDVGEADVGPGVSGRLGLQASDLLAVYVEPSVDTAWVNCCGSIDLPLLVELTFADRFAVGAGAGPHAALVFIDRDPGGEGSDHGTDLAAAHLRLTAYPLLDAPADGARRTALAIAATLRTTLPIDFDPVIAPGISVGYEAF